jgi:hypothetical protein
MELFAPFHRRLCTPFALLLSYSHEHIQGDRINKKENFDDTTCVGIFSFVAPDLVVGVVWVGEKAREKV